MRLPLALQSETAMEKWESAMCGEKGRLKVHNNKQYLTEGLCTHWAAKTLRSDTIHEKLVLKLSKRFTAVSTCDK